MSSVAAHRSFLRQLKKAGPDLRRQLVHEATPGHIKSLCEVCLNVLSRNIPVSPRKKKLLAEHKKAIRYLGNKKVSLKHKKKFLLRQTGGFLGLLANLIPTVLGGLFGGS